MNSLSRKAWNIFKTFNENEAGERRIRGLRSPYERSTLKQHDNFMLSENFKTLNENGAGERSRTPDRLITSQLLYQLSYASTHNFIFTSSNSNHSITMTWALTREARKFMRSRGKVQCLTAYLLCQIRFYLRCFLFFAVLAYLSGLSPTLLLFLKTA